MSNAASNTPVNAELRMKDSGVAWLDEVPAHWSHRKLGRVASMSGGCTPSKANDDYWSGQIPWVSPKDMKTRTIADSEDHLSEEAIQKTSLRLTDPPVVLIVVRGMILAHTFPVAITTVPVTINQDMKALRPEVGCSAEYLCYLLEGIGSLILSHVEESAHGTKCIRTDIWKNINIFMPPPNDQHAIIAFLGRETARTDALIERKRRQIELLHEKRATLISHAVTKGLDPNAKMKKPGIDWLDSIPEHWIVKRLRYLGYCQNGINIGLEYFGTGHPFVSYGNVFNNRELPHNVDGLVRSSAADRERYSVRVGDVFFTRTSETVEEIGFSSVCLNSIDDAVFAGFLIRFRPCGRDLNVAFSKFCFQNILLRAFFVKEMNLVTRASLSQDLLKQMPVLIPPLEEQAQIASFLDRETGRIDSLIEKIEKSNSLLREYRTALISAAVTGKIDVRQEVA